MNKKAERLAYKLKKSLEQLEDVLQRNQEELRNVLAICPSAYGYLGESAREAIREMDGIDLTMAAHKAPKGMNKRVENAAWKFSNALSDAAEFVQMNPQEAANMVKVCPEMIQDVPNAYLTKHPEIAAAVLEEYPHFIDRINGGVLREHPSLRLTALGHPRQAEKNVSQMELRYSVCA